MREGEITEKMLLAVGSVITLFSIVNMQVGYVGDPAVTEIDFFVLLIGFVLIGMGIFFMRENTLKKRRIAQLISVVIVSLGGLGIVFKMLCAPFLHCYACPLASTACPIGTIQNFVILGKVPYYLIGYTTVFFVAIGRAFCSWACPFGLLQDGMDKIFNRKITTPHRLRFTKFVVLAATVVAAWYFADTLFCKICPAGFIEAAVPYRIQHGMVVDTLFIGRIVFFIFLMGIILVISRFWCRSLCPLGAWVGIFNKVSLLKLHVDMEKCDGCGMCADACPMGIDPVQSERSTDCTLCGECVEVCRNNAIEFVYPTKSFEERCVEEPGAEKKETVVDETPLRPYTPSGVYRSGDEIGYYDLSPEARKLIIRFYHLEDEIPPILTELQKFLNITFIPLEDSEFLEPTLIINNRIFTGELTEEGILEGLREEIAMGNTLDLVFDLEKCRYCKIKNCGMEFTGETGFRIEKLIDYPDFSEIIASCTKSAVFIAYGDPKIEYYDRRYILDQKLSMSPLEVEIVVEKDSKYCNKALTIFALLSYVSNGTINFKPRDYEKTRAMLPSKIRSLPSILIREQKYYLTTERSLIQFLRKL